MIIWRSAYRACIHIREVCRQENTHAEALLELHAFPYCSIPSIVPLIPCTVRSNRTPPRLLKNRDLPKIINLPLHTIILVKPSPLIRPRNPHLLILLDLFL
jgi:hypothetical protein